MIIYNVTIKVATAIDLAWVEWMKNEHIPEVMQTGFFVNYKFCMLLQQDDSDGKTYVCQYFCGSLEDYNNYIDEHAARLRDKTFAKFGDQCIAFRTLMQEIN